MSFPEILRKRLKRAESTGCLRELGPRRGIDFCSNDYLGFSQDPLLKRRISARMEQLPTGSSGSRLIRGQLDIFESVEKSLAAFSGREAAVLFPSGYQANVGLLSGLLQPGDIVFSDEMNHASLIDGIRLSRADVSVYPHGEFGALRELLAAETSRAGLKVIVSESLFSMDGDRAFLAELVSLSEEFSALLVIDESHATGLWGQFTAGLGAGLVQSLGLTSKVFATVHAGGKAFGCGGAWIACGALFKQYLVNFCRPFIYSTAPMPVMAAALDEAVGYWREVGPNRAFLVHQKSERFRELMRDLCINPTADGPIFPVITGSSERAVRVSSDLRGQGFDVRAIRPPTVPDGSSRLRITIRAGIELADLERFAFVLASSLEKNEERQ